MRIQSRLIASIAATVAVGAFTVLSMTSCGVVLEPVSEPTLHYKSTASGCANFTVFKWNESMTEALVVDGFKDSLNLSTASRTFDLATTAAPSLRVRIDRYTRVTLAPYCTDVRNPDQEAPHVWTAVAGTATITLDRDTVTAGDTYKVTVKLQNVRFSNGSKEVTLAEETFNDVVVGWLPG
jgi:hypothetical protein